MEPRSWEWLTLRTAGKGRGWRVRYRAPDGRERSKSFSRKVDAERFAISTESQMLRGEWVDARLGKVTLMEWSERWFATTTGLKPKTRAGYYSLLRTLILPSFGTASLARIQPVDVRAWVAELSARGLSPSRIKQAYHLLSSILRAAVESGYIGRSPCIGIKLPRMVQREMHFLSAQEVELLVNETPPPYDLLIYVLAYGGLRWGEAVALRRSRCDLARSRLLVAESLADVSGQLLFGPTKTYAARNVVIPRFLVDELARHLQDEVRPDATALVFTGRGDQPLRNSSFHKAVCAARRTSCRTPDSRLTPHLCGTAHRSRRARQGDPAPPRPLESGRHPQHVLAPVSRGAGSVGEQAG